MSRLRVLQRRSGDTVLFATVLALLALGLVMVYSSSSVFALERMEDSAYFLKRQVMWMAIGLVAMMLAQNVHYSVVRRLAGPLVVLAILGLVAVLVPGVGRVVNGARRWIYLGPISIQPVELAKLAIIAYAAHFVTRRGLGIRDFWRGVMPPLGMSVVLAALVLKQPDMGSAMILVLAALGIVFLGGARLSHIALVAIAAIPTALAVIVAAPYRFQRLMAFVDPWKDPQGAGFHVIQSLLAFGSGGVLGVGLGASAQKFFYLPERHTDFIFAILGEELGLVGTTGLICLFALFAFRGLSIARRAPDRFGALLAGGITATITGQALLNMGVATGVFPITGLTLPFVSFGGSSLIITMIQVGVLSNISQYARRENADRAHGPAAETLGAGRRRDGSPGDRRPRPRGTDREWAARAWNVR
jgi:cell division protein FtsW